MGGKCGVGVVGSAGVVVVARVASSVVAGAPSASTVELRWKGEVDDEGAPRLLSGLWGGRSISTHGLSSSSDSEMPKTSDGASPPLWGSGRSSGVGGGLGCPSKDHVRLGRSTPSRVMRTTPHRGC